jgi:hypothetical protein
MAASASTTGKTRRCSSSAVTGSAFGLVDSPPTSMIAAPSASMALARAMAASNEACRPPSENESGVTFRMPMISAC